MKCAVTGCNGLPTTLAIDAGASGNIAVDDTSVYWANSVQGTVVKLTPK